MERTRAKETNGTERPRAAPPPAAHAPESAEILEVLEQLGLEPAGPDPIQVPHALLLPALGNDGREFLLKYFLHCPAGHFDPPHDPAGECQRREAAFYRFLDVIDRSRLYLNAPGIVVGDSGEPPRWLLFRGIRGVRPAADQNLRPDWLLDAFRALRRFPLKLTEGRRGLGLERWDPFAHREVVFRMQARVEPRVGTRAWDLLFRTLQEAREWTDSQDPVLVLGRCEDEMLLLDDLGRIYLHEFRRVGYGNPDHDFAWYWVTSTRDETFKRHLFELYCSNLGTAGTYRVEWAARSVAIYLACLRIAESGPDAELAPHLELLERAVLGGSLLFP